MTAVILSAAMWAGVSAVPVAAAPAGAGGAWPTLEQSALAAIAARTGGGPASDVSALGDESSFEVSTVDAGPVPAQSCSLSATFGGTIYSVTLTLLDGEQLLVDYAPVASTGASTGTVDILALAPGTATVTSAATATDDAPPPTAGNCSFIAYDPTVIGSDYGPLIEAVGGAGCTSAPEVLGAVVGISSGGSGVGSPTGGSSSPDAVWTYIAPYDYAPCTVTSSSSPFQTVGFFSVNGTLAGNGSSGVSSLDCQS